MEFDPLRDERIAYALLMLQTVVSVELHNFPGAFHGSMIATSAAVSQRAQGELFVAPARGLDVQQPLGSAAPGEELRRAHARRHHR